MSRVGMGVICERTCPPLPLRSICIDAARYSMCTAFRPDLCPMNWIKLKIFPTFALGPTHSHTTKSNHSIGRRLFKGRFSVAVNRPFAGALTPLRYFSNDQRVKSIMVEVNRRLYLDEGYREARQILRAHTKFACQSAQCHRWKCRHNRRCPVAEALGEENWPLCVPKT